MSKKNNKRMTTVPIQHTMSKVPIWIPVLMGILYFLALSVCKDISASGLALLIVLVAAVAAVMCYTRLKRLVTVPMAALFLLVLLCGVSTFYADNRSFALEEFLKIFSAYGMALLLVLLSGEDAACAGHRVATVLEAAAAFAGVVSIDLLSTHLISDPVLRILDGISGNYRYLPGVEIGVRMTSMFTNPNAFAGCMGIGVLLSLGLVLSSESRRERMVHLCCLFICALSFVLAFSMGATAMILPAFLLYLILEKKERRAALFFLMLQTLVLAVLAAGLIYMTAFDGWSKIQPVPMLCVIVGAAASCVLDRWVMAPAAEKLQNRSRLLLFVIVALLLIAAAALFAACTITGTASLEAGEEMRRAVYPEAGDYTVSAQADGSVTVIVTSQNQYDTMMHTATTLYEGALSEAAFTVPEDSLVVYLHFRAPDGTVLERVVLEGEETVTVPLGYPLLPGFISNRLQGLRANQNAIQRLVFFEDGMKLFREKPLFGGGLAAYENGVFRVQSFFYETKYTHNHYIQTLVETGAVGLLVFLLLLIGSAAVILRQRKAEDAHPMSAALFALLIFMAGHAFVEVIFSFYAYLPFAYGAIACISLCCAKPICAGGKKLRAGVVGAVALLLVVFEVLIGIHVVTMKNTTRDLSHTAIAAAVRTDMFEQDNYRVLYLEGAAQQNLPEEIRLQADGYAEKLSKRNSVTIPRAVAEYWFATERYTEGLAMVERYVEFSPAASETWNDAFLLLAAYDNGTEVYHAAVRALYEKMLAWDEAHMGTLVLTAASEAYLNQIGV